MLQRSDPVTSPLANDSKAYNWKLYCHWLKGLWHNHITSAVDSSNALTQGIGRHSINFLLSVPIKEGLKVVADHHKNECDFNVTMTKFYIEIGPWNFRQITGDLQIPASL